MNFNFDMNLNFITDSLDLKKKNVQLNELLSCIWYIVGTLELIDVYPSFKFIDFQSQVFLTQIFERNSMFAFNKNGYLAEFSGIYLQISMSIYIVKAF